MVKINRDQVMTKTPYSNAGVNHKTVIVIHETANKSAGAGAWAHHRLQWNGNSRPASWHYQVEDELAIQSFSEDLRLWHAGSTAIPFTIAIELCVNSDSNYNQAVQNLIELVVDIAKRNNITTNNIVTHMFYTGKNCPTQMLSGKYGWTYNSFINAVEKQLSGNGTAAANPPKQPIKTSKTIKQLADEVIAGKHGSGSERMKSLGYQYEAVQEEVNRKLNVKTPPKPKKKTIDQLVKETLAGLHGNGEERRKKLGKNYKAVQDRINGKEVNKKRNNRTIEKMAREIINNPSVPSGHANRKKWLGVNGPTYQKVRNRVNQILQ